MASNPTVTLAFSGDEKKLTKAMDRVGDSTKTLSRDIGRASDDAVDKFGNITKAADRIKSFDIKIKADTGAAESALKSLPEPKPVTVPVKADTSRATEGVADKFRSVGEKSAGLFGSGLIAGLASGDIGGAVTDIVGGAIEAAAARSKLNTDIQNQMGISPAQAKEYGGRVSKAYASGLGDSQDQIAQAYSALSSTVKDWSHLTQGEQDGVAKRAVKVAQAFGIDVNDAVRAAATQVRTGFAPSFKDAFDTITTGYQNLGPAGDDFLDTLNEYSGYFHKLGIDGPQALSLLQQGLQAGARDTDYIADAWKEFGVRIIDNTKLTSDALKGLGLDAKKIPQQIAEGGPVAEAAVQGVIDRLKGIKDPVKQNEIGIALFGTQWEDTMRQILSNQDFNMAIDNMSGATDRLVSATDTAAERVSRRWESGLAKLGEKFVNFADGAATAFDKLTDGSIWGVLNGEVEKTTATVDAFDRVASSINAIKVQLEDQATAGLVAVQAKLKGLPPNTPVKVQSLTQEAVTDLENMGYKVTHLPNGQFTVQAQTGGARGNLDNFINEYNNKKLSWQVTVKQTVQTIGSLFGATWGHADGGWVDGPGTERSDSILTPLSKNEFVVSADKAKKNAGQLEAINSGRTWSGFTGSGPPLPPPSPGGGGGSRAVTFAGNTDSAFATAFMSLVRNGTIQV
jgi:phage-related minor tail protein